jgi:hypothetical protein
MLLLLLHNTIIQFMRNMHESESDIKHYFTIIKCQHTNESEATGEQVSQELKYLNNLLTLISFLSLVAGIAASRSA